VDPDALELRCIRAADSILAVPWSEDLRDAWKRDMTSLQRRLDVAGFEDDPNRRAAPFAATALGLAQGWEKVRFAAENAGIVGAPPALIAGFQHPERLRRHCCSNRIAPTRRASFLRSGTVRSRSIAE
jgi:hypothetical protein